MSIPSSTDLLQSGLEHHRAGNLAEAESFFRHAAELDPADMQARLNLGLVLQEQGRLAEATEVLGQIVVDRPDWAQGWVRLAGVIEPQGFGWEAHDAVRRVLKAKPDAQTLVAASMLLGKLQDGAAAEKAVRRAVEMSPDCAAAWLQLGQILAGDGDKAEAAAAFRRVLEIEPDHAVAAFFLAANGEQGGGGSAASPATAPPSYVRGLFDGYADRFDSALVGSLKYRVPQLLEQMYGRWRQGGGAGSALPMSMMDAGCGTGLCGLWMAQYRGRLIGVDLSRGMIAQAQSREIYDELIAGEVAEELRKWPETFDLIVAGDVLVYIGDLTGLFAAASAALRAAGTFLFSVEAGGDGDFRLLPTQRFAHSKDYLHRLAASNGLAIREMEEAVLRQEKAADVRGYLVLMEKVGDGVEGWPD